MYDKPSYPQLGSIYPGDYYSEIPYDEYIRKNAELPAGEKVFDIRDFGAVPEKDVLNTEAFRLAAEAARKAGGGTILVQGGSYCSGTVWIPSDTTLFIAPDAELVASRDYTVMVSRAIREAEESSGGAFVRAKGEKNVCITGGGRINGRGEWFVHEPRELPALEPFDTTMLPRRDQADRINTVPGTVRYFYRQRIRYAEDKYNEGKPNLKRPSYMVWLQDCSKVRVENIILYDSMCWTLHADGCDDVLIKDVVIDDNRHVANTDGIDITGCRRVEVRHCFVSCADDGLCLKNPAYMDNPRAMEDVHIADCTVLTVMSAFKIGTGTAFPVRNVLVENCHFCMPDIYPGSVCGISIESSDGSDVSDVTVRNITMDGVQCPLYILLNQRNEGGDPYTENVGENRYWGGSVRNIRIENIRAEKAELPAIITGFVSEKKSGLPVRRAPENITVSGYHVEYRDNKEVLQLPEEVPEFLYGYPESNAHGDVPACGIWARHVDGLTLEDIEIRPRSCNTRPDICTVDVRKK